MLSQMEVSQPGRQQEHFSFSHQLLVFLLVSATPHGWVRLASRGDAYSKESRTYLGRGQNRRHLGMFLFTEEELQSWGKFSLLDVLRLKEMSE